MFEFPDDEDQPVKPIENIAEETALLNDVAEAFVLAKKELNKKWERKFVTFALIIYLIFCGGYGYFSIKANKQAREYQKLTYDFADLMKENKQFNRELYIFTGVGFPPYVPEPKNGPPTSIVINEYQYSVLFTSHEWLQANYAKALSNVDMKLIVLDQTQPIDKMRESLMHELLHLVKCEGSKRIGVRSDEDYSAPENVDHKFIEPASPTLLRTLQYNPKLVKWLEGR